MAKLMSTIIDGFISSKKFVSGLWGEGWRIGKRNNRYTLEVDDIVVRNTMTVFELLISKIRAVKGALGITQASGKVKAVTSDEYHFFVEIEEVNSFCVDDIIRCMEVKEVKREYWVIVSGVEGNRLTIARSEFRDVEPLPGDELVQFGNVSDKRRQSAIYLHADENGEPAIDVLQGIKEKSLEGCMRVRVGGLDGIVDADFREGIQDFGIYCTNGYFKGTIAGGGGYLLRSDGTGYICNGAIWWDKEKKVHFDGEVVLGWENLPPDAREQLKGDQGEQGEPGEKGEDANLLSWVKEWDEGKTQIGSEYLISPKIFSGQNTGTADEPVLTGVAIGKNVCEINGVKKSGVFGLQNGGVTFSIDAETGETKYMGSIEVKELFKVDTEGRLVASKADISGKIVAESGMIGGFGISGNYITNKGKNNDASIIFRNDAQGKFAALGGNTLPSSTGLAALQRIENHQVNPYGTNYGSIFSVKNANQNIAIQVDNGNIAMKNGLIERLCVGGIKYLSANYTMRDDDPYFMYVCNAASKMDLISCPNPGHGRILYIRSIVSVDFGFLAGNSGKIFWRGSEYNWCQIRGESGGSRGAFLAFYDAHNRWWHVSEFQGSYNYGNN